MQKLMGDEGWGGLVFLYWPQVSVVVAGLFQWKIWQLKERSVAYKVKIGSSYDLSLK